MHIVRFLPTHFVASPMRHIFLAFSFGATASFPVAAQTPPPVQLAPVVQTTAGIGANGYAGDNAAASAASLSRPYGIAADAAGNIFFADYNNSVVRRVDARTGLITTYAGTGTAGFSGDNGQAAKAELNVPMGVAVDRFGNLYIADGGNSRVRRVDSGTRTITTVAGDGINAVSGDGGSPLNASIGHPSALAIDPSGTLYISDVENSVVRAIGPNGVITTVAGVAGQSAYAGDGGPATSANLNGPQGLTVDAAGDLYIADTVNSVVREVFKQTGFIATVAGTGYSGYGGDFGPYYYAKLSYPVGMALDANGNLFIADSGNNVVRRLDRAGIVTTYAGNGQSGFVNGGAPLSRFNNPLGVAILPGGRLAITDSYNNRIRSVGTLVDFPATAVGRTAAPQVAALLFSAAGQVSATGFSVSTGQGGFQEFSLVGSSGKCSPVPGADGTDTLCVEQVTFTPAYPGARQATLHALTQGTTYNFPLSGIGVGPQTTVSPGLISAFAGTGTNGNGADGGPATQTNIGFVGHIVSDASGNVFFVDDGYTKIRRVDARTGVITTVAGDGTAGYSGDGGPALKASFSPIYGMALDAADNVYIADQGNNRVRKVDSATGIVTTIAGTGIAGESGDGGPAAQAELNIPIGLTLDRLGNIYVVDESGFTVRRIDAATGVITTVAGTAGQKGALGDGGLATSATFNYPSAVAIDLSGNLFIADSSNYAVRRVDGLTGIITTYAGVLGQFDNFIPGKPASQTRLSYPVDLTVDPAGNIYIVDAGNCAVFGVTVEIQSIRAVAGVPNSCSFTNALTGNGGPATAATFSYPYGVGIDSGGNLYVGDSDHAEVRKVTPTPAPLNFGAVGIGSTSASMVETLSNIGNQPLNPLQVSVSNTAFVLGNNAGDCGLNNAATPAGATCIQHVAFQPTSNTSVTGTMTFQYPVANGGLVFQRGSLSGTGDRTATSVFLTVTSFTPAVGAPVTVTASLPATIRGVDPTGTLTFVLDAGTGIAETLQAGTNQSKVAFTYTSLTLGSHTISVSYNGDSTYLPSLVPQKVSLTVSKAVPALSLIPAPGSTIPYGHAATVTLSMTGGDGTPNGTVIYSVDNGTARMATLSSTGAASLPIGVLAVGKHTLAVTYSGSAVYLAANGTLTVTVTQATSTLAISTSASTVKTGASFTLTAKVTSPTGGTPAGTVRFMTGVAQLGSATLNNSGMAAMATSLTSVGSVLVTANYEGSTTVAGSTSAPVVMTITP